MKDNVKKEFSNNAEINEILKERESSYGSYKSIAFHHVKIIGMIRSMAGYKNLKPTTILALEMTIHKILRMVNSGKDHEDSLADIIGYITLALNEVKADKDTEGGLH